MTEKQRGVRTPCEECRTRGGEKRGSRDVEGFCRRGEGRTKRLGRRRRWK